MRAHARSSKPDTQHDPEMTTQFENQDLDEPPDDRPTRSARWAAWAFRVLITVAAVFLFNQAVLAGQFMSGTFEALEFHALGATISEVVVLVAAVAAGVARFRGRYPLWPAGVTALLFVAINVQEFVGEQRILTVHIPLGVSIIVVVSGLTVWAWRES